MLRQRRWSPFRICSPSSRYFIRLLLSRRASILILHHGFEALREQVSPADLHAFWHRQFLSNPEQIIVGGAGASHEQLVALSERHFGHLEQVDVMVGRTVITDSV